MSLERQVRRLAVLDAARRDLERLRADVLGRSSKSRAEDRLAEVMRHRARARDLAERLAFEEDAVRADPDAAPLADAVLSARASATALAAVCDEAAADLEAALSDDLHQDRKRLRAAVGRVDERIMRVVRLESDRGELLVRHIDALAQAFAALPTHDDVAAEREVAALRPQTFEERLAAARRRS